MKRQISPEVHGSMPAVGACDRTNGISSNHARASQEEVFASVEKGSLLQFDQRGWVRDFRRGHAPGNPEYQAREYETAAAKLLTNHDVFTPAFHRAGGVAQPESVSG